MTDTHAHVVAEDLVPVEAHLADILGTVRALAPTGLSLGDAHGLVLAEDVTASTRPSASPRLSSVGGSGRTVPRMSARCASTGVRVSPSTTWV